MILQGFGCELGFEETKKNGLLLFWVLLLFFGTHPRPDIRAGVWLQGGPGLGGSRVLQAHLPLGTFFSLRLICSYLIHHRSIECLPIDEPLTD